MAVTLFILSGSPFAWKAQLALEHKAVDYHVIVVSGSAGETKTPTFLALNPHGKAPVLVHGDFVVYESDAITSYIEEAFEGPSLWPLTVQERTTARRIVAETAHYLQPACRTVFQSLGKEHDAEAVTTAKGAIASMLIAWGPLVARGFFINGDHPGAADYALYPFVALMKRLGAKHLDSGMLELIPPTIMNWSHRIEALPYFADTYPPHWRA